MNRSPARAGRLTEDRASRNSHERIRFRRDEIVDLSALPSSEGVEAPQSPRRKWPRPLRYAAWLATLGLFAIALVFAGLSFLSYSGIGARQLQAQAEMALRQVVGPDVDVSIHGANFALSGPGLLNLELTDVTLMRRQSRDQLLKTGQLRLGLDVLPLLTGKVSVASAEIADARINAQNLPSTGGPGFERILNDQGLVDPDLLLAAIFAGADAVGQTVRSGGSPDLRLKDVAFALGPGLPFSNVLISDAQLEQSDAGIQLQGSALFDARPAEFTATIDKPAGSGRVERFGIDFKSARQPGEEKSFSFGDTNVAVIGDRSVAGQPAKLEVRIGAQELAVDLGTRGKLNGKLDLQATLAEASGKIEIDRLNTNIGGSVFRMTGALGPRPSQAAEPPAYRFEFISNESELVPADTGEPPMPMGVRVAGTYRPDTKVVSADEVAISSRTGTATGTAAVTLTKSGPPGLRLALDVKGMSVSHVKQLWPWFAAESARRWVNKNLYGGAVPEGSIRFAVAPGRLGNGQKLGNDEVSGHFRIAGTRFDTAGLLPPIREADGQVNFAGDDVDITLDRGHVFVSNGQTVNADRGRLVIKDAGVRPVIGQLDIDVSGGAAAVAELASLDPINAMQRTGIEPASLSGTVSGNIKAAIPMHKGIDKSLLDWNVHLNYRDLAISKPMDGQTIRSADGTLDVDKTKAVIKAKAELNGIPAELSLLEPLPAAQGLQRQRDIAMTIDRKALQRIAPGLTNIVEGPMKVTIDASDRQRQRMEVDLTAAVLSIPAAGWTKGSGVAAKASFDLNRRSTDAELSNFKLTGATFGASGSMTVADGALSSARFDNFRLNRGDDASVRIERERGSYSVVVSGNALDGRALIRRATTAQPSRASTRSSTPVALRANIDRLTGFNGEELTGVNLNYASGGGGSTLTLKGQADRGRSVSIENSGGRVSVETGDAGSLLRFLDVYERVQGGSLSVRLKNRDDGSFSGAVDVRDFWVVNEPKLGSIASAAPQGTGRGLDGNGKARIDTSRVQFNRAFANIDKGNSYLKMEDGVLRGPVMGATFQGTLYDENNRMQITGTYMPAYALNSAFGDVPIIGALLGNGEDKGLIGVTYKLTGNAKSPNLQINPLSVIAPGIFRTIFEFE